MGDIFGEITNFTASTPVDRSHRRVKSGVKPTQQFAGNDENDENISSMSTQRLIGSLTIDDTLPVPSQNSVRKSSIVVESDSAFRVTQHAQVFNQQTSESLTNLLSAFQLPTARAEMPPNSELSYKTLEAMALDLNVAGTKQGKTENPTSAVRGPNSVSKDMRRGSLTSSGIKRPPASAKKHDEIEQLKACLVSQAHWSRMLDALQRIGEMVRADEIDGEGLVRLAQSLKMHVNNGRSQLALSACACIEAACEVSCISNRVTKQEFRQFSREMVPALSNLAASLSTGCRSAQEAGIKCLYNLYLANPELNLSLVLGPDTMGTSKNVAARRAAANLVFNLIHSGEAIQVFKERDDALAEAIARYFLDPDNETRFIARRALKELAVVRPVPWIEERILSKLRDRCAEEQLPFLKQFALEFPETARLFGLEPGRPQSAYLSRTIHTASSAIKRESTLDDASLLEDLTHQTAQVTEGESEDIAMNLQLDVSTPMQTPLRTPASMQSIPPSAVLQHVRVEPIPMAEELAEESAMLPLTSSPYGEALRRVHFSNRNKSLPVEEEEMDEVMPQKDSPFGDALRKVHYLNRNKSLAEETVEKEDQQALSTEETIKAQMDQQLAAFKSPLGSVDSSPIGAQLLAQKVARQLAAFSSKPAVVVEEEMEMSDIFAKADVESAGVQAVSNVDVPIVQQETVVVEVKKANNKNILFVAILLSTTVFILLNSLWLNIDDTTVSHEFSQVTQEETQWVGESVTDDKSALMDDTSVDGFDDFDEFLNQFIVDDDEAEDEGDMDNDEDYAEDEAYAGDEEEEAYSETDTIEATMDLEFDKSIPVEGLFDYNSVFASGQEPIIDPFDSDQAPRAMEEDESLTSEEQFNVEEDAIEHEELLVDAKKVERTQELANPSELSINAEPTVSSSDPQVILVVESSVSNERESHPTTTSETIGEKQEAASVSQTTSTKDGSSVGTYFVVLAGLVYFIVFRPSSSNNEEEAEHDASTTEENTVDDTQQPILRRSTRRISPPKGRFAAVEVSGDDSGEAKIRPVVRSRRVAAPESLTVQEVADRGAITLITPRKSSRRSRSKSK